jgi:hypothetical protein
MLNGYEVFARRFESGDLRCKPPAEGSSGLDMAHQFVEYESGLMALQSLVRAVLGVALELPPPDGSPSDRKP